MAQRIRKTEYSLTDRENEILKYLVDGYSNEEAAEFLELSWRTVEAHRARIMLKLQIHDLASLVKHAIQTGLTTVNEHRQ